MNLTEIINKASYLIGDPVTLRDASSELSNVLYNRYYDTLDDAAYVSDVFGALISGGNLKLDEIESIYHRSILQGDLNITTPENKAIAIHVRDAAPDEEEGQYLTIGNVPCFRFQLDEDQSVTSVERIYDPSLQMKYTDSTDCSYNLNQLVNNLTSGVQATKLYADLTDMASKSFDSGDNLVDSFNTIITNSSASATIKNVLINAAAGGPTALLTIISQMLSKFKETEENPDSGFSTDITVEEFSWGLVAGALTSVIQVSGAILLAMSGVFKVVGVVVSAITSLVSNAISAWVGASSGTTFTVRYGNGLQSFNLVLNSIKVQHHDIAQYLRSSGFDSFTAFSQLYPATIVGKLSDPDDNASDYITIQELASINFSFLSNMFIQNSKMKYRSNYSTEDIIFALGYNDGAQTVSTYHMMFSYNRFNTVVPSGSLCGGCYHPINLNVAEFLDSVKNFAQSDVLVEQANIYGERLYTSIILWLLYKIHPLMYSMRYGSHTSIPGTAEYFYVPKAGEVVYDSTTFELIWQCLKGLTYNYTYAVIDDSNGNAKSTINFRDDGVQDNLLKQIQSMFNHLRWRDTLDGYIYSDTVIGYKSSGGDGISTTVSAVSLAYSHSVEDFIDDCNSLYINLENFLQTGKIIPDIPSKCAVTIPTATVMSLFWGLLVDAGIAIALTATVIIGLKTARKIRQNMARRQINVEAKKYQYEHTLTGTKEDPVTHQQVPYTIQEQQEAWNEYKSERFKYNIFATFTGDSKIAFGAYDSTDTSSAGSIHTIADSILGAYKVQDTQLSNVTLYDLLKIISG